jgi:hypothetical protein
MIRTSLVLALAMVVFPACKKKDADTGAAKATEAKADTTAAGDKPAAAAAPAKMDAPALFDDFNKPGQDPMALLDKWKPGVLVSGTVTNTITEEAGNTTVWLDGGNNHKVTLGFKDDGKAAKDKGVKKDDKITAQCQIGGSDGNMMMLTDCELK